LSKGYGTRQQQKWSKQVKFNAHYICHICKGNATEAHHKVSWHRYPKHRYNLDCGVALCETCHKLVHRYNDGRELREKLARQFLKQVGLPDNGKYFIE
jgi:hypothetical protein